MYQRRWHNYQSSCDVLYIEQWCLLKAKRREGAMILHVLYEIAFNCESP